MKNVSASVRQQLLNKSRSEHRPFNELLQYYAMERFLYRLSKSVHVHSFILKGALMLRVWRSPEIRPTMDIDLLGITSNEEESIVSQILEIIAYEVEPDGLTFDSESIQTESIIQDADYKGIRIRFQAYLGTARVHMQIDIGFGDIVYPIPEKADLPTLLNFPTPHLFCYSRQSVIAEKYEIMVKRGLLNSRMKDFYDIWLLSRQFSYDRAQLTEAISLTFQNRGTTLISAFDLFDEVFIDSKQIQWAAFCNRLKQEHVPVSFQSVVRSIQLFLTPVSSADSGLTTWPPAGPWS